MMQSDRSAVLGAGREIRPATPSDQQKIADLIFFESHVHRHLDWRTPLDWLGFSPYWVLEEGRQITAALACPTDPATIAWLRIFAYAADHAGRAVWDALWEAARGELAAQGGATAAAIATQDWFQEILLGAQFGLTDHIVLLEWNDGPQPQLPPAMPVKIRQMTFDDLPRVVEVDSAAFQPLWRNSMLALTKAYQQSTYASVAEDETGLVGYQMSTGGAFGAHLARLAVRPATQRRGIGALLVGELIVHMGRRGGSRVTVNTQRSNAASLALYARLGFRRTGDEYPVYTQEVA